MAMLVPDCWATVAHGGELFPHVGIDASLPFNYTNNALNDASDRRGDSVVSPLFKASFGQLKPTEQTLGYSVYATANIDAFARVKGAQDGLATVGGNVTAITGNFSYGGIFEHSYFYDGIFQQRSFIAEDLTAFVTYKYENKNAGLVVKTSFTPSYRFSDDGAQERALYTLKVDIKKNIVGDYYLVGTPRLRVYQFTADTNSGRVDVRPSVSGGIEYDINDDVSFTVGVEYDRRFSNFAGKDYNSLTFGASLDFSHTYDRSWTRLSAR
jgi:hypothetical protein